MDSTQQSSSVLSSIVRDPHVQALLRKETSTERAASREEAKLEQLVVDSDTPLYDGCNPEVTLLSFMLQLLKTKAKNKWTDTSLDEHLKYLKDVLPVGNYVLLVWMRPRRSCALLICHTIDTMHASTIA